jgi:Flp pilus assembly protein TadG
MKPKLFMERGQALILIALAAIGLFGVTGLAIDGSAKFSDRRHAQNAADAASLAGALAFGTETTDPVFDADGNLVTPIDWKVDALNIADQDGYHGDHVSSEVKVYLCSEAQASCGTKYATSKYVQVIITSNVNTYFARVIGIHQTHNTVQAVALAQKGGPFYDGNLIVALNPNTCTGQNGNIVLGGNGEITLTGGGLFANSGGTGCGIEQSGCPTITVTDGSVSSTGDGNVNLGSSSVSCSASSSGIPAPSYNSEGFDYPPEMPVLPPECTSPYGTYSNPNSSQTVVTPGRWNEFPPTDSTVQNTIIMEPGVYCVDDVIKLRDRHLTLWGHDVMIYIRSGNYFQIEGGTINLDAPDDGPYAGYLVIVDSTFSGTPPNCSIDGNSINTYEGTIFAPYCDVIINGDSTGANMDAQIIGYTVTLNGGTTMDLNYDLDKSVQNPRRVGLMR